MNFHTAEDGHVYNDDKKSINTHHGSVKPSTGIKAKTQKTVDPEQEYAARLKKLSEEGRYKPDVDQHGYMRSNHIYNLDDIDKGKEMTKEMDLILSQQYPERGYSIEKYFGGNDERVKEGVLETLGRNMNWIKPFLDYRLEGEKDGKHWVMAMPLCFEDKADQLICEDHGGFETDAYKHKVDFVSVPPHIFLNWWAASTDFKSDKSQETIAKYKKAIMEGKPLGTPFIQVDAKTGEIYSHEGRHRAQAAQELGVEVIPVEIIYDIPLDSMTEQQRNNMKRLKFQKQTF